MNDKKQKKKKAPTPPFSDTVKAIIEEPPSKTDPQGWYTGKPEIKGEVPVQDADDL